MTIKRLKTKGNLQSKHAFYLSFIGLKGFEKSVLTSLKNLGASEALIAQASEKLSEKSDPKRKSAKLSLTTDTGACVWFFAIGDLSTFEQHTTLRKSLSNDFSDFKKGSIYLDVKAAGKSNEKLLVEALASLLSLSHWKAPKVTKETKEAKPVEIQFDVFTSLTDKELKNASDFGLVAAEANNAVRTLSDMPANRLTPSIYLGLIRERAKKLKYKVDFHDRKALEKIGAGSFLAVTQGNLEDDGGIVHLSYKPKSKKKKLLLVGKGLCFDTGGYNIKTRGMYGMQKDMTGSAIALAVLESVIRLGLPYEVHAFLGLAENLVSYKAYKPSDVVVASDGTSIEVTDTDAEGRMVLADVLGMARREGGDLILDFATLTGSVIRALDMRRAGVYSNRPKLLSKAFDAGEACGERVWGFPIGEDYREQLKSDVADILQCRIPPEADHIYAATFLSHFVGEEIPWVHMDLAPADCSGGLGLVTTTSTGFGVRWALSFSKEILGG